MAQERRIADRKKSEGDRRKTTVKSVTFQKNQWIKQDKGGECARLRWKGEVKRRKKDEKKEKKKEVKRVTEGEGTEEQMRSYGSLKEAEKSFL